MTRYQNFRIQGAAMSVKKKPSGGRSAQVEVEAPGGTQSAAERRSAKSHQSI